MSLNHPLSCYYLVCYIRISLELAEQFVFPRIKQKNRKLIALSNTTKNKINAYDAPIIKLSSIKLSDKALNQLALGYVDKNKHIKKNLTANFEPLAQTVDNEILNEEKEDFLEFLQSYCDIFSKNVYSTKDYTY